MSKSRQNHSDFAGFYLPLNLRLDYIFYVLEYSNANRRTHRGVFIL